MEISFNSNTKLQEIQEQFVAYFPHLKIEFFKDLNGDHRLTANEQMRNDQMKIADLLGKPIQGSISFDGTLTVAEFEQKLKENFGFEIQVFRKSGNTWLVTQQTDSRSLNDQEAIACEMANPVEQPEPGDYQDHE